MSDEMTLKLMESNNKLAAETVEVNMLVRRMDFNRDTLNKINERNDAIYAAIIQIDKSLKLDDQRIIELQAQTKSLESQTAALMLALEFQKQQTELLHETLVQQKKQSEQFDQTARSLNQVMQSQEARINGYTAKIGEELRGRMEASSYSQVKWLIVVGASLLFVMALLALRH
jgi:hypothetical protein